jgi:hypothetical protein
MGILDSMMQPQAVAKGQPAEPEMDDAEGDEDLSPEEQEFLKEELLDADIASYTARTAMNQPKIVEQLIANRDNAAAVGTLLATAILKTREKFLEKGVPHSNRIWTADNGVLKDLIGEYMDIAGAGAAQPKEIEARAIDVLKSYDKASNEARMPAGAGEESAPRGALPFPAEAGVGLGRSSNQSGGM